MPSGSTVTWPVGPGAGWGGWAASAVCSSSGSSPSVTWTSFSWPLRQTLTSTSLPIGVSATIRGRERILSIVLPSNSTTTSPCWMPAFVGRPAGRGRGDQRTARVLEAEGLGDSPVDVLDPHAEPAPRDLAGLHQAVDHGLRQVGGDREADADVGAGGREDGGVDAQHPAVEREARTARVAAVDGGVDLEEVVVGAVVDVTAARRDDAGGDRRAEAERVADRHHPVADAGPVAVRPLDGREGSPSLLDLEQRQVGLGIAADQLRRVVALVAERDRDLVGVGDDVVVGHHEAARVDDEARAEREGAALLLLLALFLSRSKKSLKNSSNGEPGGNCGCRAAAVPPRRRRSGGRRPCGWRR